MRRRDDNEADRNELDRASPARRASGLLGSPPGGTYKSHERIQLLHIELKTRDAPSGRQ